MAREGENIRLDFLRLDSLSRSLLGLVKVVWSHICKYYGIEIELPPTKFVFIEDKMFSWLLKQVDISSLTKAEYGRDVDAPSGHMIYLPGCSFKDGEFDVIAFRKSKLQWARRVLIRQLRRHFTTPEFLVIELVHESIHMYENHAGRTYLNHSENDVTEIEINIFMAVKKDDPEFFSKKNETNVRRLLDKIPD